MKAGRIYFPGFFYSTVSKSSKDIFYNALLFNGEVSKKRIFVFMKKQTKETQVIAGSFLNQHIFLYHVCATLWFVGALAFILFALKYGHVKLVPDFLKSFLIEHDWLTIVFFPLAGAILAFCIYFGCQRYKWYCSRITYKIENGNIFIGYHNKQDTVNIEGIVRITCRIRRTLFPLTGRGQPLYHYYDLLIELPNRKLRYCCTPFAPNKEPEDFMKFIDHLKSTGLSIEMKESAYYKYRMWKLKNDKLQKSK